MFTNDLIVGFIAFACAVAINRLLAERALKRLSVEEKARLLDSFSGHRIFSVVSMLIVVVVFFAASKAWPEYYGAVVWGLFIVLVLMSIGNSLFSYVKLKKLAIPKHYAANFLIRCAIYYSALFVVLFTIATKFLPQ
jgi:hypothetical protein